MGSPATAPEGVVVVLVPSFFTSTLDFEGFCPRRAVESVEGHFASYYNRGLAQHNLEHPEVAIQFK